MGILVEIFAPESAKGRGLRALSTIEAGKCVLEDEPYAYTLNKEQLLFRCDHCLREFNSGNISENEAKKCGSCKRVLYCNKACQVAGRKEHRYECKLLRGKTEGCVAVRLLTKMLLKIQKHPLKGSIKAANSFPSSIWDLCSLKTSAKEQECIMTSFRNYEKGWRSKIDTCLAPFKSQEVLDLYERMSVNTFSLFDEMSRSVIGEALYIRASMFNHSCEPNCTFVFDGTRLNVRAIRRIEAGEECCISYVSSLLPARLRQEKLSSIYGFTCCCPRCLDSSRDDRMWCTRCRDDNCLDPVLPLRDGIFQTCNTCHTEITSWDHSTDVSQVEAFSEEVLGEVKKVHQGTPAFLKSHKNSRLTVLLNQCMREQSALLHPTHHCVMRIHMEAMRMFSSYGHWKEALEASQGVLDALRLHLDMEDPYIAFFLYKLSIIHYHLGDTGKTNDVLDQAIPLLEIAYGLHHPVTQHAKDLQLKSS